MQLAFTAADIAAITEPKATRGDTNDKIRGIAGLAEAEPGDLSFLGNTKYKNEVPGTRASLVLLPKDFPADPRPNQLFLHVDNPSIALARICARVEQALWPKPAAGIHATAAVAGTARVAASATVGPLCVIEEGAVVGEHAHLQAQVFIGRNATVGDHCWLMPGVIIGTECQLGKRVRLQPGVVVGADGFGYEFTKGRWEKLPQVGTVVIEDDVEIGANSTLDRARFSRTVVGEGTKIDNLVQIGHNVTIGRHCMICAQTGISGSAKLEDFVVLGGQVGVAGHLTVGRGVQVGGQAGINGDVEPGQKINGTPAIPYNLERRIAVLQRRLPELFKRVESLEAQLLDAKKSSS